MNSPCKGSCEHRECGIRRGLYALGEAYGRKVDADTVRLWLHATRDLTLDQWRFGVDTVIRSNRKFFPAPGEVMEAAYGAVIESKAPPVREGQFWASPMQEALVVETVRENPRRPGEGPGAYIRRIAVESKLMSPDKPDQFASKHTSLSREAQQADDDERRAIQSEGRV